MRALIDGDMLAYRACRSVETEERFGLWQHMLTSNYEEACLKSDRLLDDVLEYTGADRYMMYFSCPSSDNWRKKVMPGYKENRKDVRKPLCMGRMVDDIIERGSGVRAPNMEADDLMGIACTGTDIIVSGDKDFRAVPGRFMRLTADWGKSDVEHQTFDQAKFNHMVQALAGDPVDGYKGCPTYGPVKAAKHINAVVSMPGEITPEEIGKVWSCIVQAYADKGLDEGTALKNAQVAYILNREGEGPATRWQPTVYSEVY